MSVRHETFTVTRDLPASHERVFGLWSEPKALERWYLPGDDGWKSQILEHDFKVGGRKHLSFGPEGETPYEEDCRFEDIIENERILYSMTVSSGDGRISSSMVTVEFNPTKSGTRIQMTEQMAILDGGDSREDRLKGWGEVFDKLELEF